MKLLLHSLWLQVRHLVLAVRHPAYVDLMGSANRENRTVCLPKWLITDVQTYTIFLHEVGHIVSPNQIPLLIEYGIWHGGGRWQREVDAWIWAQKNAIVWTPEMDAIKDTCLTTYLLEKPKDWALCKY